MSILFETSIGDIVVDLYVKKRKAACFNFLKLCKIKYYNYCLFHTVQKYKIAQSGDPSNSKLGGISIFCNLKYVNYDNKPIIKHSKGVLSMVNNGNNKFGSQFFITIGDNVSYLDGKHLVFGCVSDGIETLEKFNEILCDESDQPFQDIWLNHTIILSDPFEDPETLINFIPDASPLPTYDHLFSNRIALGEEINGETVGNPEEKMEKEKAKVAKTRAKILEIVGDIPKASIKPKENILFICKLNPVTVASDLEIIFSRFGTIKSCEIIYDKLTNTSLGYGFIEYESTEQCEQAYLQMDNVLIDERRIHVDFCQSVHKQRMEARRQGKKF